MFSVHHNALRRKTSLQRNRYNTPSDSPKEYYKEALAIPLLDTLLTQMNERFSSDKEYIHGLFGLIPAVMVDDEDHGLSNLVHWEQIFPSINLSLMRWKDGNVFGKQNSSLA